MSDQSITGLTTQRIFNFWNKIKKGSRPEDCWEWTAFKTKKGYGMLGLGKHGVRLAHRISWYLHSGNDPIGICVLHKCDNPQCCNPNHLFLGTRSDNNYDKIAKGRNVAPPSERCHLAKFSIPDIAEIRAIHARGEHSLQQIGDMFGTSKTNISFIVRRITWKNVA